MASDGRVPTGFGAALRRLAGVAARRGLQLGARELQRRALGSRSDQARTGGGSAGAGSATAPGSAAGTAGAGGTGGTAGSGRRKVELRRAPREATGTITLDYAPRADGKPDPGEIVWAWVPFEENDGRGKDRPVLVVGRDGNDLLGLMLTSKDHDRDAADEARYGRHWLDIGTGGWDAQGRASEVRVDRVLRLAPSDVRREGVALDRTRFERIAAEVRRVRG